MIASCTSEGSHRGRTSTGSGSRRTAGCRPAPGACRGRPGRAVLHHLRADVLDPLQVRRVAGIGLLQGGSDLLAQFRVLAGHPHQHVAGVAEALHHGVLVAGADQLTTHLAEIGRLFVGQLDQRTAGEVEAEVDALGEPAAQGDDGQDQGDGKRDVADAHEVDGTDLDIHLSPLRSTAS